MRILTLTLIMASAVLACAIPGTQAFAETNACVQQAAQPGPGDTLYYNQVVVLRNGENLVGRVEYDTETDSYTIKLKDGGIRKVLRRDVDRVEEYSRTYLPPEYHPTSEVRPCDIRARERQWYYAELRGWGMYTGSDDSPEQVGLPDFTFGPEAALGFRIGRHFGLGLGGSYFTARDITRIPLFLHARYQFSLSCISPFVYALAGIVSDNQSGENIALNKIFHPGPKITGFGIGVDYALVSWLDLSADLGYRYLQLPTKLPCDCSDAPPLREAVFYNESHGVILRLGVTF